MRWKPLEDRRLPDAVAFVVAVPVLILLTPLIAALWLDQLWQKKFGPKAEWSPWFAWHPVRTDHGFGHSVWLETVERRAWYGKTVYRDIDAALSEEEEHK